MHGGRSHSGGKTALLHAILGEMCFLKSRGRGQGGGLGLSDRTVFTPQVPFVVNSSVEGNSQCFGSPAMPQKRRAATAAELNHDLENMGAGAQTETERAGATYQGSGSEDQLAERCILFQINLELLFGAVR